MLKKQHFYLLFFWVALAFFKTSTPLHAIDKIDFFNRLVVFSETYTGGNLLVAYKTGQASVFSGTQVAIPVFSGGGYIAVYSSMGGSIKEFICWGENSGNEFYRIFQEAKSNGKWHGNCVTSPAGVMPAFLVKSLQSNSIDSAVNFTFVLKEIPQENITKQPVFSEETADKNKVLNHSEYLELCRLDNCSLFNRYGNRVSYLNRQGFYFLKTSSGKTYTVWISR